MKTFNFPDWDSIIIEVREIIIELLKKEQLISEGDIVVEGVANPESAFRVCKIACKAAQAYAIGNCPTPACIAAAIVVGDACCAECG